MKTVLRIGTIAAVLALLFLVHAVMTRAGAERSANLVIQAALFVTLALSLNLVNGITGQFSLGHIAFYAVGAYAGVVNAAYLAPALPGFLDRIKLASVLQVDPTKALPVAVVIGLSVVIGTLAAAIAGYVVGLPSLRLRGDYLAIVTLGAGEIVRLVAQNAEPLGAAGGRTIQPQLPLVGLSIGLALFTIWITRNLQVSARGLDFLAVREDEIAASAMGVNVTRVKVSAFVIASALAGAAGATFAHYNSFVSPSFFTADNSILIVTMVVLGGTGSITGSVIAAILLFSVPEALRSYQGTSMANVVGLLVAIVVATALLKRIKDGYHGPMGGRVLRVVGTLVLAAVALLVVGAIFGRVAYFQTLVEGNKLRQVVPAITLVVMMLLRPQGIFGHKELSFGNLFGGARRPAEAA